MDDEDGFRTTPTPRDNPLLSFAWEHITLVFSAFVALMFGLRCFIVTEGDPYMTSLLLSYTSLGDATPSLLFSALPLALLSGSFLAAFMAANTDTWGNRSGLMATSAALYIAGMYVGGFSWLALLYYPLVVVLLFVSVKAWKKGPSSVLTFLIPPFLLFIWVIAPTIGSTDFWLPTERLVFVEEDPFTGYVLRDTEDTLVILKDRPRVVILKPKDVLRSRDLCLPAGKARSSEVAEDSPVCP